MKENPAAHIDAYLFIHLSLKNEAVSYFVHTKLFAVLFPFGLRPKNVQEKWLVEKECVWLAINIFSRVIAPGTISKWQPVSWLQLRVNHMTGLRIRNSVWDWKIKPQSIYINEFWDITLG
jgi:hypothetical protein